jgi:hypothetical protein
MIYVLECPEAADPRVWFAYDVGDLQRKFDAAGGPPGCEMRLWADEQAAILAFENDAEPLWQGLGWKARWALREQLVATDALADA